MANANWSNPTLTSTYTNFVSEVKNRDEDLALQFDGTTSTNIPTNAIRWDSSAGRWKKWSGSIWAELASTYALTELSTVGKATFGGLVGIGTTNPGATLDVSGNIRLSANAPNIEFNSGGGMIYGPSGVSNTIAFATGGGPASPQEKMRLTSAGYLGIGTTSPTDPLQVIGAARFGTGTSSSYAACSIYESGNDAVIEGFAGNDYTSKKQIVLSPNYGQVKIGDRVNTNSTALYLTSKSTGSSGISFGSVNYPGYVNYDLNTNELILGASSLPKLVLSGTNNTFTAPSVYAQTTASAANVFVNSSAILQRSTSSIKYKTNVETLEDSYADAILDCRPVWYKSLCKNDNSKWGWWGFIAEEVAEIDPRLVHWKTTEISYTKDGTLVETPCDLEPESVAYDRFIPHLLNLIKRQGKAIATLQTEVANLKAQNF